MFEVPGSTVTAVHVDAAAVLGEGPVQYKHGSPTNQSHADTAPQDMDGGKLARTGQQVTV